MSSVSRSQPVGLYSKALPLGGRRPIILKGRARDLTLKCSLSSSQPLGANIEYVPFGGKNQCTLNAKSNLSFICFSALVSHSHNLIYLLHFVCTFQDG